MSVTINLDVAIRAVCPIDGVSIGSLADKSTWSIQFSASATADQRAAAQAVLTAFDPTVPSTTDLRLATDASEILAAKQNAAIQALVNSTPAQCVQYATNNFPSLTLAEQNKLGVLISILAIAVRPAVR